MFRSTSRIKVPGPNQLFNSRKKRQEREAALLPSKINKRKVHSLVDTFPSTDCMELDSQTFSDLQIFQSQSGGETLFDYCNHTRNAKGAKILRARFKRPFSNPDRITAVQRSLAFISCHLDVFDKLPTHVTTNSVEIYTFGSLPLAMSRNIIEFIYEVLDIRFGDSFHYNRIIYGVEMTANFIRALRAFIQTPELSAVSGELADHIEEMRSLLSHEDFSLITDSKAWSMFPWRVLRIDQGLRLKEQTTIARLLHLSYEIDALVAMAKTSINNDLITPEIVGTSLSVHAEGLFHPLVTQAIPNALDLEQDKRFLYLTGPNMAGKTTYLRSSGVALFMAHLGMGVAARRFRFFPSQRLFTSISLEDNLSEGVSYFRAEALRIKEVSQALADGYRVIAILDEPFKGTNVKDALDASIAIMQRFAKTKASLFMFSSHLIEMKEAALALKTVTYQYFEAEENEGDVLGFDYILKSGVSSQRLGMRVLREEGIFDLLDGIAKD